MDCTYLFLTMDSVGLKIRKRCQLSTNVSKFDKFARISPLILGLLFAFSIHVIFSFSFSVSRVRIHFLLTFICVWAGS